MRRTVLSALVYLAERVALIAQDGLYTIVATISPGVDPDGGGAIGDARIRAGTRLARFP